MLQQQLLLLLLLLLVQELPARVGRAGVQRRSLRLSLLLLQRRLHFRSCLARGRAQGLPAVLRLALLLPRPRRLGPQVHGRQLPSLAKGQQLCARYVPATAFGAHSH